MAAYRNHMVKELIASEIMDFSPTDCRVVNLEVSQMLSVLQYYGASFDIVEGFRSKFDRLAHPVCVLGITKTVSSSSLQT